MHGTSSRAFIAPDRSRRARPALRGALSLPVVNYTLSVQQKFSVLCSHPLTFSESFAPDSGIQNPPLSFSAPLSGHDRTEKRSPCKGAPSGFVGALCPTEKLIFLRSCRSRCTAGRRRLSLHGFSQACNSPLPGYTCNPSRCSRYWCSLPAYFRSSYQKPPCAWKCAEEVCAKQRHTIDFLQKFL